MRCHNCGFRLQDNAKFCEMCGAPQQLVGQNNGPKVPSGNNYKYQKNTQGKEKKKIIVLSVVLSLLAIVITVGAVFAVKSLIGGVKTEESAKYITYYKDRQILQKKSEKLEGEAFVLSDFAAHSPEITNPPDGSIQYSADNDYVFYPEEYTYGEDDDPSTFTLMKQKVLSGEAEEVADSVQSYQLLQDGGVVYQSISSDLYLIKKDEKKKIGSDAYDYKVYEDKGFIVWTVEHEEYSGEEDSFGNALYDELYDIYVQPLDMKGEKKKLLSDAEYCFYEKKAVLVKQEGDLYCINDGSNAELISKGVDYVCQMLDDGTIIYEKNVENDEYMDYQEWVNDPYYDTDMQGEPDYDSDEDNWNAWYAREEARSSIEDLSPYDMDELYVYHKGKEQLLSNQFCSDYLTFPDTFCFYYYNMDDFKKVEMDDLAAVDDGEYSSLYYKAMEDIRIACFYVDGKVITLEDDVTDLKIDKENGIGYGIVVNNEEEDNYSGTLYSFDATGKSDGSLKKIADGVNRVFYACDKKVYYGVNTEDSDYETLYCNGKRVASDVIYALGECNGKFYYMIDGSSIESFDGKKTNRVADDVLTQGLDPNNPTNAKGFLILHDSDSRDYTGVLSWCDGSDKLTKIDDEVSGFVGQVYFDE